MAWYSFDHFQRASVSGAEEEFNPSGQESGLSGTVNFEIHVLQEDPDKGSSAGPYRLRYP